MKTACHSRTAQRGVALAIVVWFLAAMSLLVAGIVLQARVDIKLAQVHAEGARVEAAGDGAIQLALAELLLQERTGERAGPGVFTTVQQVGGYTVIVNFTSVAGLVDLNRSGEGLLATLLASVEDIDEATAEELALRMVEWRSAAPTAEEGAGPGLAVDTAGFGSDSEGEAGERDIRHGEFEAIEDLLLVPGMDRRIFEAIKDSVYVSRQGQSGVDWAAAPVPVLRALGELDEESAYSMVLSRLEADDQRLPPQEIMMDFQEAKLLATYRIDALVQADDTIYQRRRWVDRAKTGLDGLPWRFIRTDELVAASGSDARLYGDLEALYGGS